MAPTTRTTGPLHFEDLEPRRFEDLVRQLAYDFRPWRTLEATGRSGSDEGFDIRGWELATATTSVETDDGDAPEPERIAAEDRAWLIQCKRERSISPARLAAHLEEIPVTSTGALHGLIFAAACDFSLKTRNTLRAWARRRDIAEVHVWGKAELEDQLFQPKNDSLLFAYFGISLKVRQRAVATELRSWLAAKRKVLRAIEKSGNILLLRDPEDSDYPYAPGGEAKVRGWRVVRVLETHARGLVLETRRHVAIIDEDGEHWDYLPEVWWGAVSSFEDPWSSNQFGRSDNFGDSQHPYWSSLPDTQKANYMVVEHLPWSDILDVDALGDPIGTMPHVFVADVRPRRELSYLQTCESQDHRLMASPELRRPLFPQGLSGSR